MKIRSWWLGGRMLAWAAALRVLKRLPLPRLAALVRPRVAGTASAYDSDPARIIALAQSASAWTSRRPETMCLVRSLVGFRYLCLAGLKPELRIGLARERSLEGHAWVELDGRAVNDHPASIAAFTPVLAIASDGRVSTL
jgi:transglutaminase superfamily protein